MMQSLTPEATQLAEARVLFAEVGSAVVSDAVDEVAGRGAMDALEYRGPRGRAALGRALTVALLPREDAQPTRFGGGVGGPLEAALTAAGPGDFLVFDLHGSRSAAVWGGLASRFAVGRGVAGTVVWGCCRDVDEILEQGLPVWSLGSCPRRSRNDFVLAAIGEPVQVAGVSVSRDDLVFGDSTGVVVVPIARLAEVVSVARRIQHQESALVAAIDRAGDVDWSLE